MCAYIHIYILNICKNFYIINISFLGVHNTCIYDSINAYVQMYMLVCMHT